MERSQPFFRTVYPNRNHVTTHPVLDRKLIICRLERDRFTQFIFFLGGGGGENWLLCLFVFLLSCDGCVALLRGAMGLSADCDCGIS